MWLDLADPTRHTPPLAAQHRHGYHRAPKPSAGAATENRCTCDDQLRRGACCPLGRRAMASSGLTPSPPPSRWRSRSPSRSAPRSRAAPRRSTARLRTPSSSPPPPPPTRRRRAARRDRESAASAFRTPSPSVADPSAPDSETDGTPNRFTSGFPAFAQLTLSEVGATGPAVPTALPYTPPDHSYGEQFPGKQAPSHQLSLFEAGWRRRPKPRAARRPRPAAAREEGSDGD